MSRNPIRLALLGMLALVACTTEARAQVFGTFHWQMQPYCNRVTLTLTSVGGVFRLDGADDLCGGAARPAGASGTAIFNPDGTVGLNFTIVGPPSGAPVSVAAVVSPANGQGTWRDDSGHAGTFAFFAAVPNLTPRPGAPAFFRTAGAAEQLIGLNTPLPITSWTRAEEESTGGGIFDPLSGSYTVPAAGVYALSVTLRLVSVAPAFQGQYCSYLFVNGVQKTFQCAEPSPVSAFRLVTAATTVRLNAGDVVSVRAQNATAASGGVGASAADNVFTVTRLQ